MLVLRKIVNKKPLMRFFIYNRLMYKAKDFFKDLLSIGISVIVITFILLRFILMPVLVHGNSMLPTLEPDDYGYSFKIARKIGIKRFDVVVIDVESDDDKLLVKRLIGLPNEKIEYIDNHLYVNGEYVEEDFLADDAYTADFAYELGDDEYFVMGDNRLISKDSRFYGSFSGEQIVASHLLILFPFGHLGVK